MSAFRSVKPSICHCIWLLLGCLRKKLQEDHIEETKKGDHQRVERYKEPVILFSPTITGLKTGCLTYGWCCKQINIKLSTRRTKFYFSLSLSLKTICITLGKSFKFSVLT